MLGQNSQIPIEIISRVFILSADTSPPDHYYKLCLVHPTLYADLKTHSLFGKFNVFTYRLDRLFHHPTYKSWILHSPREADSTISKILLAALPFWSKKVKSELNFGVYEKSKKQFNCGEICVPPDGLVDPELFWWERTEGCAHRLLTHCVKFDLGKCVLYLCNELGVKIAQFHLWGHKSYDLHKKSSVYAVFDEKMRPNKEMLRLLVRECGASTECFNGRISLLQKYVNAAKDDLDEEVLLLMLEGHANLKRLFSVAREPRDVDVEVALKWAKERKLEKVEEWIDSSAPSHYYHLCLVNRSLYKYLCKTSLYSKCKLFVYRPDRIFVHPSYRSVLKKDPNFIEILILRLLKNGRNYWKYKISQEIELGKCERAKSFYKDDKKLAPDWKYLDWFVWVRNEGCANQLLRFCVRYNLQNAVRFLVLELGARMSGLEEWDHPDGLTVRHSCLRETQNMWFGFQKDMVRFLVRECEFTPDWHDCAVNTSLLDNYLWSERNEGRRFDEEIIVLFAEAGADLKECVRFLMRESGVNVPVCELLLKWARD
ncbi:hypothetical protein HK098_001002 [Nowakowskiella sp. JEL0407]|nr:hypothetical protein HK098_001002 [Nowakowskiella sp. JEL0407]